MLTCAKGFSSSNIERVLTIATFKQYREIDRPTFFALKISGNNIYSFEEN